jgi:hypothetical protein
VEKKPIPKGLCLLAAEQALELSSTVEGMSLGAALEAAVLRVAHVHLDDESICVDELDMTQFFYQTRAKVRRAHKTGIIKIHGNHRFTPEQEEEMVMLIRP